MFCKNCGMEIKNNGRFCPKCGREVKIVINESIDNSQTEKDIDGTQQVPAQGIQKDESIQENIKTDHNLAPVMSVWSYLGLFLLASIPIVGIIIIIVFAISSNNQNKTNYCRAIILGQVILFFIVILFWSSLAGIFASLLY